MEPSSPTQESNVNPNEIVINPNMLETPLSTEGVGVDEGNKIERIQESTTDIFENANEKPPVSQDLDNLAIVPYKPEENEKSMSSITKGALVTTSVSAATWVYGSGIGVSIVEGGAGLYTYMTTVPAGASLLTQYLGGYFASGVGVSAGVVVKGSGLAAAINAAPALIFGAGLMYGGAYLYNKIVAETPDEKMSVKMSDLAKPLLITDGK